MTSQTMVQVNYDEFSTAASRLPKMKRAPRGAIVVIPTDTLLSSDQEGIMVETSAVSSLVSSGTPWTVDASVHAKRLIAACGTLKKLGASGQTIEVGIVERNLFLSFRTTRISIPTLWVK